LSDGKQGLSDWGTMGNDGRSLEISVGSFWKTNPPGGGFGGLLMDFWVDSPEQSHVDSNRRDACSTRRRGWFSLRSVGSAQAPELRPSGVGTTRRHVGATPAPPSCETKRIFSRVKTGDKLLRCNSMRCGSEDFSIRFVWNGNAPVLNRSDATERVPPGGELESGRADNGLAACARMGYKAGE
jgi:hypothetical protein